MLISSKRHCEDGHVHTCRNMAVDIRWMWVVCIALLLVYAPSPSRGICVEDGELPRRILNLNCTGTPYQCCASPQDAVNDSLCVPLPWSSNACQGGFYLGPDNDTLPCPDGFYCPENALCMVRCSKGAYCKLPTSRFNASRNCSLSTPSQCCDPYYAGSERRSANDSSVLTCGGASRDFPCTAGFYCPSPTEILQCPSSHYCRAGSVAPLACPSLSTCKAGSKFPGLNVFSLLLCIILSIILAGIAVVFKQRRHIQDYALKLLQLEKSGQKIVTHYEDKKDLERGISKRKFKRIFPRARPSQGGVDDTPSQSNGQSEGPGFPQEFEDTGGTETNSGYGSISDVPTGQFHSTRVDVLLWLAGIPRHKTHAHDEDSTDGGLLENLDLCKKLFQPKEFTIGMEFENLSLTVKDGQEYIIKKVTGSIKMGKLTAIMGGSGTGKTSLMKCLCGKAYYAKTDGVIRVNGRPGGIDRYRSLLGYVPQDDIMHSDLTVHETLMFQALLRLPAKYSRDDKLKKVSNIEELLCLDLVRDHLVGSADSPGQISGGQRKRVNIGMELVADSSILFLDEPTSGLDSTTSKDVIELLKCIALVGKVTVVLVIHQPRYDIFEKFDDLILLERGGRIAFQGSPDSAQEYFKKIQPRFDFDDPPPHCNPADYYLDNIAERVFYVNEQKESGYGSESVFDTFADLWNPSLDNAGSSDGSSPSKFVAEPRPLGIIQFLYFVYRQLLLLMRTWYVFALDLFLVLLAGGVLGAIYNEITLQALLVANITTGVAIGLTGMITATRPFGSPQIRPVFWRESSAGVNRVAYFCAGVVVQLLPIFTFPIFFLSLFYTLTGPSAGFGGYYVVCLFTYWAVFGIGYVLSLAFHPDNSKLAAVVIGLIASVAAGSPSTTLCKLQKYTFFGPALYTLSYHKWFAEGNFELEANTYPPVLSYDVELLAGTNDYTLSNMSTILGVLFSIGLGCRIIALLLLLFTHRGEQK